MQNEPVHIRLNFNDMIMSVCDDREQLHKDSKFWLPWGNMPKVDAYLKMNKIGKIDCKKDFGSLVGGRIILLVAR